jgi:hypothetical protein
MSKEQWDQSINVQSAKQVSMYQYDEPLLVALVGGSKIGLFSNKQAVGLWLLLLLGGWPSSGGPAVGHRHRVVSYAPSTVLYAACGVSLTVQSIIIIS